MEEGRSRLLTAAKCSTLKGSSRVVAVVLVGAGRRYADAEGRHGAASAAGAHSQSPPLATLLALRAEKRRPPGFAAAAERRRVTGRSTPSRRSVTDEGHCPARPLSLSATPLRCWSQATGLFTRCIPLLPSTVGGGSPLAVTAAASGGSSRWLCRA
nr:hypothetical protein Iba_chr07aCG6230 [Ipomoea batatas]